MPDALERLKILINSSTPIVVMETVEETRAVGLVCAACAELNMAVFEWSIADGLVRSGLLPPTWRDLQQSLVRIAAWVPAVIAPVHSSPSGQAPVPSLLRGDSGNRIAATPERRRRRLIPSVRQRTSEWAKR